MLTLYWYMFPMLRQNLLYIDEMSTKYIGYIFLQNINIQILCQIFQKDVIVIGLLLGGKQSIKTSSLQFNVKKVEIQFVAYSRIRQYVNFNQPVNSNLFVSLFLIIPSGTYEGYLIAYVIQTTQLINMSQVQSAQVQYCEFINFLNVHSCV